MAAAEVVGLSTPDLNHASDMSFRGQNESLDCYFSNTRLRRFQGEIVGQ
jgi:hypothetical protein